MEAQALRDELRDHGRTLAGRLGFARDTGAAMADTLRLQYDQWPRRYHDARHLLACVRAADSVQAIAPSADAVSFALWFHDAVYRPWRHDNEARSALQSRESARRLGLGLDFAQRVAALVLATAHLSGDTAAAAAQNDEAAAWVLDIDLGILGAPPDAYDRYEEDVRREYFFVTPGAWRKGRATVLSHFLGQPRIYRTEHFAARLEAPARANLERALAALRA